MNIVERGRTFLQSLRETVGRTAWDWRRCPTCGETLTQRWGTYTRHPWFLHGRQDVVVQRHRCTACRTTYSEQSVLLVRGGWYAREVRRCAIDHWQHVGASARKTAEFLRSLLGHQERWLRWRPLDFPPVDAHRCHLSPSSVARWVDAAGRQAKATVKDQLQGVPSSGQLATDGLWARLRGKAKKVVLLLADPVSGLIWPPVVVEGEGTPGAWKRLFARARRAGLDLARIQGLTSDGAKGLEAYLARSLTWVAHQRCVFHLWRGLAGELAAQANAAAQGLKGEAAKIARRRVRAELVGLVRAVYDAPTHLAAQAAFARLAAHPRGAHLADLVDAHLDTALVHLFDDLPALGRTNPEWLWRDFRLRAGHGRNQGASARLERSALLFAIYHNFEPTQERSERKRTYRHPGLCPLAVAGVPPNEISYLDALNV